MAGEALTYSLNRKAGTLATPLACAGAANLWASTVGLGLVGALNVKNGSVGFGLQKVLNALAGTQNLAVDAAARAIP